MKADENLIPDTLTVVFANTYRNEIAVIHENQSIPWTFRTVQIRLTNEQREQLRPKCLGSSAGKSRHEELYNSWLERVEVTEVEA